MNNQTRAMAIVGVGAILPDALNPTEFWNNLLAARYSITETPANRWSIADYFDPDPNAPDKTYSKIGGWVRGFEFDWKKFKIPPKVVAAMDPAQQWAVTIAAQALEDYGYPQRPLDTERVGVVLGTAMGGENHYVTTQRIVFPEYAHALEAAPAYAALPTAMQAQILGEFHDVLNARMPQITEDSMPGELANIVSGRVANVLNLRGPNFITDAACASSLAALDAAFELLSEHEADAVITGGVDRNMGVSSFVKFCKIGALSGTGTRPFGKGADGFVMGEGSAAFLVKRLEDAERDGDKIYAVVRGVGAAGDGKGKGITAPNPIGQQLATKRAWENAGLDPASAVMVEAHGTSTRIGDVVEVNSLATVFGGAAQGSIALGSVKSNIGHLKAGAGAAGLLKAVFALHHKVIPPTLHARTPNPDISFEQTPFYLVNEQQALERREPNTPRRVGVSSYGFGGTNFHAVLEEHVPGLLTDSKIFAAVTSKGTRPAIEAAQPITTQPAAAPTPPRGIFAIGAVHATRLQTRLTEMVLRVRAGYTPEIRLPDHKDLQAPERIVVDYGNHDELLDRLEKAVKALGFDNPAAWKALQAQGIFRGSGTPSGRIAFLFPGQGSQYLNMGRELAAYSPTVNQVFTDADAVMQPILGKPLTHYVFADGDTAELARAEKELQQTAITQPAMLTLDTALYQLLGDFGFKPDIVMGHSLGEYAALIAAGIMPFADALEASAARGAEMTKVSMGDNGWMAAVMVPDSVVEQTLQEIDGYVVVANSNGPNQSVIGGESKAVGQAIEIFTRKGFQAQRLPVSHAFHTKIVAPASAPLRQVLNRLHITPPQLPLVANVTGEMYPTTVDGIKDILEAQVYSPVQWSKGVQTLYAAGVRTFVEVGPKKALKGLVDDILSDKSDVISLFTNHPKMGEMPTFNQALCGLFAAGYGASSANETAQKMERGQTTNHKPAPSDKEIVIQPNQTAREEKKMGTSNGSNGTNGNGLAELLTQVLEKINTNPLPSRQPEPQPYDRNAVPLGSIVFSGTGLGLPGAEKPVMDPDNAMRILRGEQFVDLIPERFRRAMLAKRVTRLVKGNDGSGHFETITDPDQVIKLAGRPGPFDLTAEYGVPEKLVEALDITTQLAMASGFDALREAGIPLVPTYKKTSKGTYLPERFLLPVALRDETGIIFASAFPGGDRFADEFARYYEWENRSTQLKMLLDLQNYTAEATTWNEINRRIGDVREQMEREPYQFDRRFLFRVLAMGHSQFAEYIGARGPNTHVNAACASTTQAIGLAEDWIRDGRARRVIVIAADAPSGDHLIGWLGAGFLATGAVATDDRVEEAALPFDHRRHGTLLGMGACAIVVESEDAVRERGMRGMVELLASETNNSAFHGTRLDVNHISQIMNNLVTSAEHRFGINRMAIAPQTVFMSHETFTPARGGSAAAEVYALRQVFGQVADDIVVANTKGFTGHPFGVGIEDVIAAKILEYGIVPPVPNFQEVDPDLGALNLSRGGRYPVQYALHLAAGFGSQIAMTLTRRIPGAMNRVDDKLRYKNWLAAVSGYDIAETEIVKRVLRVQPQGAPKRNPAASTWQNGTGPTLRTPSSNNTSFTTSPARMVVTPREQNGLPQQAEQVASLRVEPIAPKPERQVELIAVLPEPVTVKANGHSAPVSETSVPVLAPAPMTDPVVEKVLDIVAAKTGYPREMLDLDLDMEADLGIDTVKQAETFAAIRETFNIPRQDNLKLRDYPTLKRTVEFVHEFRPDPGAIANPAPSREVPQPMAQAQAAKVEPTLAPDKANPNDPVTDRVLDIVAAKTGYPKEMLDLDLDMEADLGVDTVKQAETFAAVRQEFGISPVENMKLRDYPTLQHVIDFVRTMKPELALTNGHSPARITLLAPAATMPIGSPLPTGTLQDADRIPRRVPTPTLRPPFNWCKATGVTLNDHSRVIVMLDRGEVGKALVAQLEQRGVTTLVLDNELDTATLEARVQAWCAEFASPSGGGIQGVYWLPALDVEPTLEEMDLATWRELNRVRVKNLYTTMRALYESINKANTFLVSATRLGGLHGYNQAGASAPLGGAVVGFIKAYKRERNEVLVKAVDFELDYGNEECTNALLDETLFDPGVVEVGVHAGYRYSITLVETPITPTDMGMKLDKSSVFVITGAAGGITSAITNDLAVNSGGTFYLLDLIAPPDGKDEYVRLFRENKDALKAKLIQAATAAGEKPTPVLIDKKLLAIEREEAALRALTSVQAAGGTVHFYAGDLRDADTVAQVMDEIRARHGKIDVLVHAAGLEISRALPDKDAAQFNLVFDVKADGFFNLLHAARGMPIGATVVFSSVAGRFGNSGQTDYSAANDLLCKLSSSLRQWRPDTRGIAIDWSAWGDIGMATRGSIPKIMEMAGIDMLPGKSGIPTVRRELTYGNFRGEIVVGLRLGTLTQEWDATGGLDTQKISQWLETHRPHFAQIGQVQAAGQFGGIQVETKLDPKAEAYLYDHQLDNVPLLPGVMGTETFAELAQLLAPDMHVEKVLHGKFERPFKFYRMEPQTLHLSAWAEPQSDGALLVHTALKSVTAIPRGEMPPQAKTHFTADVLLTRTKTEQATLTPLPALSVDEGKRITAEQIYKVYFHGPAYQVLEGAQVEGNMALGEMKMILPPDTAQGEGEWLMAPRLIELCFQTAGLWEIKTKGVMALPLSIGSVSAYRQLREAEGKRLYAMVNTPDAGKTFDALVVDETGAIYVRLNGYRTVQLPDRVTLG